MKKVNTTKRRSRDMRRDLFMVALVSLVFAGFGCAKEKGDQVNVEKKKIEKSNQVLKARKETPAAELKVAGDAKQIKPPTPGESMVLPSQAAPKRPKGVTLKQFFASLKIPAVVASVDGAKITKNDLYKEVEAQIPAFMRDRPLPPRALAGLAAELGKVVESVINRKLMLQLAAADGVKPSPELLTKAFDKYVAGLDPKQRANFEKALAAQGSSIAKKREEASKDVTSQEAVAINSWITDKVLPTLKVDDAAAAKFYKENQARFKTPATVKVAHILIAPEKPSPEKMKNMTFEQKKAFAENADKKAKAKAEKILAEVKKGGDFAKLAKENSSCPSGKMSKGELPAFDRTGATADRRGGRMDPTFTAASFKLKPGEISDLVKTSFGYHIIKEIDANKASTIPFEKVKPNLIENLKKEQMGKKIKSMIDAARKKHNVKIFLKGPVVAPKQPGAPTAPITL